MRPWNSIVNNTEDWKGSHQEARELCNLLILSECLQSFLLRLIGRLSILKIAEEQTIANFIERF